MAEAVVISEQKSDIGKVEWDLTTMYSGLNDPQIMADRAVAEQNVQKVVEIRKNPEWYLHADSLAPALAIYNHFVEEGQEGGKPVLYFSYLNTLNQDDEIVKALLGEITEWTKKLENLVKFFELDLGKTPADLRQRFLQLPELQYYHSYLERIYSQSRYDLSEEAEQIINSKSTTSSVMWSEMMMAAWSRYQCTVLGEEGKPVKKVPYNALGRYAMSPDPEVRRIAYEASVRASRRHVEMATQALNACRKDYSLDARLRGFPEGRPDHMRFMHMQLDPMIVDVVVPLVSEYFSTSRELYRLKADLRGLSTIPHYERALPYGSLSTKKYFYPEVIQAVREVSAGYDPEFAKLVDFFTDGRSDIYPRKGKAGGGACNSGVYNTDARFYGNYTDTFFDARMVPHEIGHGIHFQLIKSNQPGLNWLGQSLLIMEVPSTFLEDSVLEHLHKNADPETALAYHISRADGEINNVHRQVMGYLFERDFDQAQLNGDVSRTEINRLFLNRQYPYYGDAVTIVKGGELGWAPWPHLYGVPYYILSYALCFLVAKAIQALVRQDRHKIALFKELLAAGSSDTPQRLLEKIFGIDITKEEFWRAGLEDMHQHVLQTRQMAEDLDLLKAA